MTSLIVQSSGPGSSAAKKRRPGCSSSTNSPTCGRPAEGSLTHQDPLVGHSAFRNLRCSTRRPVSVSYYYSLRR